MESHSIFMKLKTFLQISFCKRPSFCNNHDVLALSCQFPLAWLPIFPRQLTSKEICSVTGFTYSFFSREFFFQNSITPHSELITYSSLFTISSFQGKFISGLRSFFLSALNAAERLVCAGRSSKQTDLTVGLCVGWCLVTACHLSQSQARTVPDPPIRAQISAASS